MNLLVTGAMRLSEEQFEYLRSVGHDVAFLQNESDPLPVACDWVEGVICNGLFLHHSIEKFTSLCFIQLTSAGYDRVPVDYIRDHDIELHNARGVYSIPMAEFAVASVLGLYKRLDHFRKCRASRLWEKHRDLMELFGKTVCIVGCGNIGTECAKRFRAFGCNVIGVDIIAGANENFSEILPVTELVRGISDADIVILTLPLTEDTKHIFSKKELDSLKDGCTLVNISRGAIVDTEALTDVLKERDIYAILDVFEEEPLSEESPLWKLENAVITPHNSFVGEGNADRMWNVIKENLSVKLKETDRI